MSGVYYGLFVVAILLIIRWYAQAEQKQGQVEGFLSRLNMRSADDVAPKKKAKVAWTLANARK